MRMLDILVDLDQICTNLNEEWLALYNKESGDNKTIADIYQYNLGGIVKPEYKEKMYTYLKTPGLFRNLKPLPGAIEAVQYLKERGHEVTIASSSIGPQCTKEKGEWLEEHMPFINVHKETFFGHKKYKLAADVIIDDAPNQIGSYRKRWPNATILTIAYPYNNDVAHLCTLRADGFHDIAGAWDQILGHLDAMARKK